MKKVFFLFFIAVSLNSHTRQLTPSTIGEIYNDEIGDSFEYSAACHGAICLNSNLYQRGKDVLDAGKGARQFSLPPPGSKNPGLSQ